MKTASNKFSFKGRLRSFKYAFDGFKVLLKYEHNARLHLFFAFLAIIFGYLLKINTLEWLLIVFSIGFVFVAEIFNTCVEEICNFICAAQNPKIKKIKDLAALAVLFSAGTAGIIGAVIFAPKLISLFC